jgi:hypothetical protein
MIGVSDHKAIAADPACDKAPTPSHQLELQAYVSGTIVGH